jgi:hypothetical protein
LRGVQRRSNLDQVRLLRPEIASLRSQWHRRSRRSVAGNLHPERNLGRTAAAVNRGCDRTPQPSANLEPRLAAIVRDRVCENDAARGGLRWTRRELGGCVRRDDANFIG